MGTLVLSPEKAVDVETPSSGKLAIFIDNEGVFRWKDDAGGLHQVGNAVTSVAGKTGAVTLTTGDISGLVSALAGLQPLDADLTAIAAVTTQSYGRSLLAANSAQEARVALHALPTFNILDHGASTGAADNASAINATIEEASAAGGGRVIIPIGTFLHGGIIHRSNVTIEGLHPEWSVLKLKNAANTDSIATFNYGASGQDFYGVCNLMIDGNKANNPSGGMGIKSDGRRVQIHEVRVKNCKSDGINHKQSAADLSAANGGQDTLVSNFYVWNCDGWGVVSQAHDCQWDSGFVIGNTKGGVWKPSATGPMVATNVHAWGAQEYAWKIEDQAECVKCQAEGATVAQVYCGWAELSWDGRIFVAGTPENIPGIQVAHENAVVRTSPGTFIEGTGTAGGVKFTAPGSSSCWFQHHFYDAGAGRPAFTKEAGVNPNRNIRIDVTLGGSSVIGEGFVNGRKPRELSYNPSRHKDLWRPESVKAENIPRATTNFANSSVLTSGTLYLVHFILPADETISAIQFWSATTAGVELKNQYALICDRNRKVLARSTDLTTAAWGANSKKSFTLAANYTPPWGEDQPVYIGLLVKATTVPTLQAIESTNTFPHNEPPILAGASNAGLEGLSAATEPGATLTAITAAAKRPYCTVS